MVAVRSSYFKDSATLSAEKFLGRVNNHVTIYLEAAKDTDLTRGKDVVIFLPKRTGNVHRQM